MIDKIEIDLAVQFYEKNKLTVHLYLSSFNTAVYNQNNANEFTLPQYDTVKVTH